MYIRRYHPLMIALHWLMFLLFVVALSAIVYRGGLQKGDPAIPQIMAIHKQAGVLVLILAALRLIARFNTPTPAVIAAWRWQRFAAHALHVVLYLVMFALPIIGILMSQSGGRAVELFGLTLPTLVAKDAALHDLFKPAHEFIGNAVYFLVGLHIFAALWHHYILRDETLLHMSPRQSR